VEGNWFFGVFDGHGKEGDVCAQYVKKGLPETLGGELVKYSNEKPLDSNALHGILKESHTTCNRAMNNGE